MHRQAGKNSRSAAADAQLEGGKTSLVVLAAGIGSRYGGIKQLAPVGPNGETILEYGLFDAERAGFQEVVFIIRKALETDFRTLLLDRLRTGLTIRLAYQETGDTPAQWAGKEALRLREKPWGTGHALWCARDIIDSPFAVINADDYYGPLSYSLMHDFLAQQKPGSNEYAMVGFELGKTLSSHGPVARGICEIDDRAYLTEIVEHTKLEASTAHTGNRQIISTGEDGSQRIYHERTTVSMNLWGFTPRIMSQLSSLMEDFLATNSGDQKAEFYLPGAIRVLIQADLAAVRVLHSPESWFGVTYRPDIEEARRKVRSLVEQGVYPSTIRKRS